MKPDTLDAVVILALVAMLGLVLAALAFWPIPKDNVQLFTALASGVVGAGVATVINNRWGTSRSSETKNATIATLVSSAAKDGEP